MPPTDSMEKPPTVERTGRPIAVFSNSYARLPERFFARLAPTPATKPRLIKFNELLASELGINTKGLEPDELAAVFAGNVTPPGAEPIAMTYAGHQFGSFVPQLGDGRAILLGEVLDRSGERRDVQLKGAGRTPFSRRGDGRAALGPVLREYLVSEAMHALGIPTTRALAAVSTGEPCLSRPPVTRSRADPHRIQPHPGRDLPVFRRARRPGGRRTSFRLRH